MNADSSAPDEAATPHGDPETVTVYSLDIIARLAGVPVDTVLHYQALGIISGVPDEGDEARFDADCLRQLRRILHLRDTCVLNDAGVKLVMDLLNEVERLQNEQRRRLR